MQPTKLNAVHAGHLIHVVTTASGGAKLFIDDACADTTNDLYATEDEPALVGFFGENHEFAVDVYIKPLETPLVEVRVNGEFVGGDRLDYAVASD
jgi:hypothetical protein